MRAPRRRGALAAEIRIDLIRALDFIEESRDRSGCARTCYRRDDVCEPAHFGMRLPRVRIRRRILVVAAWAVTAKVDVHAEAVMIRPIPCDVVAADRVATARKHDDA